MSGGGSSRTGGDAPSDDCGSLTVETTINSPVRAVIAALKKDDQLAVEIQVGSSGAKSLVAKTPASQIAGSLTPPGLVDILKCIERGYQYVAVVLNDPNGGIVQVRIQGKT